MEILEVTRAKGHIQSQRLSEHLCVHLCCGVIWTSAARSPCDDVIPRFPLSPRPPSLPVSAQALEPCERRRWGRQRSTVLGLCRGTLYFPPGPRPPLLA